jgi:hypothetical protein
MKPVAIGMLMDATVMVDHESRSVIIAHPDMPPIKFSIDHPYIQGTKLEREARLALTKTDAAAARSAP